MWNKDIMTQERNHVIITPHMLHTELQFLGLLFRAWLPGIKAPLVFHHVSAPGPWPYSAKQRVLWALALATRFSTAKGNGKRIRTMDVIWISYGYHMDIMDIHECKEGMFWIGRFGLPSLKQHGMVLLQHGKNQHQNVPIDLDPSGTVLQLCDLSCGKCLPLQYLHDTSFDSLIHSQDGPPRKTTD